VFVRAQPRFDSNVSFFGDELREDNVQQASLLTTVHREM